SPKPDENLKQLLKNIDEKEKVLKYEQKSGKVSLRKGQTSEKLQIQIEKLTERIKTTKLLKQDKEDNKTTVLGTSKIHDVPIAKIFNKTLHKKFQWVLDIDVDWEF
ncbi:1914_t:CDS:2, partial [Entrophospora sp. SA101]